MKTTQKYTTDASPSWNGYNHQGKVGIFVVLKMINDLKLDFEMCTAYELELEWLEDFSIKKNNEYIAIHQVKTYNATAPSTYKDAIWLLLAKLLDFPEIEKAYLHTTSKISKIDNLKEMIYDYKPPKEPPSISKKTVDESTVDHEIFKKYWTPKQCHDYVKDNGRYYEAFDKFAVYLYENGCQHCSMDEIENKIKAQLVIFYGSTKTPEQLDRAYLNLLGLVDKHIRERHINIQVAKKGQKATIYFQFIYELIGKNYELPSREYIIYKLRDRFSKLTNDFLEDLYSDEKEGLVGITDKKNLYSLINSVLELNDESFLKFCMKITPHHEFRDEDSENILDALSNYISETHMSEGYLEILKQIRREVDSEKYTFFKMGFENQNISYLPTTIIDVHHKRRVGRMVERILKNSSLIDEVLHEIDVIITKHINLPVLEPEKFNNDIPEIDISHQEDITGISFSKLKPQEYHNRITKIKKIRMVDIDVAKGELD
ncbi:ABC-three component system protein [Peribacillus simplex]|uniref:ABC-three component system protein n=1 Tax=Peribacillus simplex TaxID=1478 RepID=UPI003CFA3ACE